jgi:hypothetical protein
VNRLYFVRADPLNQNLCALPSNFDTLTFWAGNVGPNQRNFTANYSLPNGKYYAFIPKSQLTKVYQKANASAPAGTNNTWFSYDLDTPFQLDPSKPFVLDITFKGTNTNAQYSTYGGSRFLIGKYPTVTSTNTVDDAGSSTSGFLSFLGVDIVTANKPHHVLKAEAYPNPATQSVSVRVPNPTEATAELVSIDGRRVSLGTQSGWAAWGLPAGLPTGLYTLLVQQQGVAYKTQLAVQ